MASPTLRRLSKASERLKIATSGFQPKTSSCDFRLSEALEGLLRMRETSLALRRPSRCDQNAAGLIMFGELQGAWPADIIVHESLHLQAFRSWNPGKSRFATIKFSKAQRSCLSPHSPAQLPARKRVPLQLYPGYRHPHLGWRLVKGDKSCIWYVYKRLLLWGENSRSDS